MSRHILCALAVGASWLVAGTLRAEPALDAARVIDLAARRSPEVRRAAARIEQARGRLAGARVFSRDNPTLAGQVGPRLDGSRRLDVEAELVVPVPLAGRGDRVVAAQAEIEGSGHELADVRRRTIGLALAAYYRALHAVEVRALATRRQALAADLQATALDRQRAGDASQFEVNLAEIELARAASDLEVCRALEARARAELAILLGLPSGAALPLSGALADRAHVEALVAAAAHPDRPDVLAARAEVRQARAEGDGARAARIPALALSAAVRHEEGADVLLGGLALSLPLFEHGQGAAREADARRREADIEVGARRSAARAEIEAARTAAAAMVEAARRLESLGLRRAVQSEEMAREAYRAGRLDLPALIVIRRDALETRHDHADRLLDAALATVELAMALGAFR